MQSQEYEKGDRFEKDGQIYVIDEIKRGPAIILIARKDGDHDGEAVEIGALETRKLEEN